MSEYDGKNSSELLVILAQMEADWIVAKQDVVDICAQIKQLKDTADDDWITRAYAKRRHLERESADIQANIKELKALVNKACRDEKLERKKKQQEDFLAAQKRKESNRAHYQNSAHLWRELCFKAVPIIAGLENGKDWLEAFNLTMQKLEASK